MRPTLGGRGRTGSRRRAAVLAAAAATVLAAAVVPGWSVVHGTGDRGVVPVTMRAFSFGQEVYDIAIDGVVEARNTDTTFHTFTVPALDIDIELEPGQSARIRLSSEPGRYTLYCRPHSTLSEPDPGKAGMAATLIVR